ncbi:hypothetical protein [Chitinophaga sp. XS-30]|uniref:hypothetical protein n=1 Tax=Chitinophaga sp. XS-30 TaxID=2604421 RepID=UPI0011DE4AA4|nr:hypothetical protein [Chitinophaga sp. XS-30]QEH43301.1 hypothetical protein FW415_21525 [Chitinophaga sp. XS-30]
MNAEILALQQLIRAVLSPEPGGLLERIKSSLPDANINERLHQLILDVATENMTYENSKPATFSRFNCLLAFLEDVLTVVARGGQVQRELHVLLCSYNINHQKAIQYCKETIETKISAVTSLAAKVDKLALIRKRINQITGKDDHVYEAGLPDLKKQLNIWIDEEIAYLEKRMTLGLDKEADADPEYAGDKIVFDLNIQELACLMNAAEAVGIVKVRNTTQFLKAAARIYATNTQDVIDPGSLRTLYYKNRLSAMIGVRDKITDLLNEMTKRIGRQKKGKISVS